jgi:hypothetical protein
MHRLSPLLVRNADHGALKHRRMARERVLHLGRIHVLPARDDHVPHPVDHEDEAVFVHVARIGEAP